MHFFQVQSRRYARFARLKDAPGLVHAFATRPMDVSVRIDARAAERRAAREQMARDLGLDPTRLHHTVQVHEPRLALVDASTPAGALADCDGLLTTLPGAALMTFSADCPLVLIYDPQARALGMMHSSWRCTVAHSTRLLVEKMQAAFGSRPAAMFAGVGPSAGPLMYVVQDDVYQAAGTLPDRERLFPRRAGRLYFDLWEANRRQLIDAGVEPRNIEVAGYCTMTHPDVFFSYRREGAGCGHFGLMAALRD
ncbi:Laccase domain protein [Phycisphaerae bacterium RAS1]|nr:Laccase domain protein [Phycisphaerae bacterium RAS1]